MDSNELSENQRNCLIPRLFPLKPSAVVHQRNSHVKTDSNSPVFRYTNRYTNSRNAAEAGKTRDKLNISPEPLMINVSTSGRRAPLFSALTIDRYLWQRRSNLKHVSFRVVPITGLYAPSAPFILLSFNKSTELHGSSPGLSDAFDRKTHLQVALFAHFTGLVRSETRV